MPVLLGDASMMPPILYTLGGNLLDEDCFEECGCNCTCQGGAVMLPPCCCIPPEFPESCQGNQSMCVDPCNVTPCECPNGNDLPSCCCIPIGMPGSCASQTANGQQCNCTPSPCCNGVRLAAVNTGAILSLVGAVTTQGLFQCCLDGGGQVTTQVCTGSPGTVFNGTANATCDSVINASISGGCSGSGFLEPCTKGQTTPSNLAVGGGLSFQWLANGNHTAFLNATNGQSIALIATGVCSGSIAGGSVDGRANCSGALALRQFSIVTAGVITWSISQCSPCGPQTIQGPTLGPITRRRNNLLSNLRGESAESSARAAVSRLHPSYDAGGGCQGCGGHSVRSTTAEEASAYGRPR